ncbi:MAG TPA: winged helix-turn-helix domain-containing protein [Pyrinomonadaceae bacterium]|nr:winged helix-turn-helix domain-containing protein [Pyrinomonadaceae bacterium]
MQIYKFRDCLLNTAERSVIKGDAFVDLTTKTFDVLQFLIENSGRVVTKDELLGEVWCGNFVEESNLPVHISKLRRSLGENRGSRFIETVQGVGYRFVAPVYTVDSVAWQDTHEKLTVRTAAVNGSQPRSIAVLPFLNAGGDVRFDYIADGLTESVRDATALLPDLKVIAGSTTERYRQQNIDPQDVGETLGLSWVLLGELRVNHGEFIVNAKLVRVSDGTAVWSAQLQQPPSSLIKIVTAISSSVSEMVNGGDGKEPAPTYPGTRNAESYREYLRGRYFFEKRTVEDVRRAIECFRESIAKDPNNVYPYASILESYRMLHALDEISYKVLLQETKCYLDAASKLDQNVAELQMVYGELKLQLDWDLKSSEQHILRAIELNPNSVTAYHRYVGLLLTWGRGDEAVDHIKKILELDPLSLLTYRRLGRCYYALGRYDEALEYLADALELEPSDYEVLALMGSVLVELERFDEATILFHQSMESYRTLDVLAMVAYTEALMGRSEKAREILNTLERDHNCAAEHPLMLARLHIALGEKEAAYALLERAVEQHEVDLFGITYDPRLKLVREEERFVRIIERMGFNK